MHRFYCPQLNSSSPQISILEQEEIHHLRHVLRMKEGDQITVFNGRGQEASGRILSYHQKEVRIQICSVQERKERAPWLILACAVPKKSKFELIIEKATELGVHEIIPLKTQRTEISLNEERSKKKNQRFQTVAINASKQCQRATVPVIRPITKFSSALDDLSTRSRIIIPSLMGDRKNLLETFREIKSPQAISFLIGPEGDFTKEEYVQARKSGCLPVSLGETVLKVETAAISALACAHLVFHHE